MSSNNNNCYQERNLNLPQITYDASNLPQIIDHDLCNNNDAFLYDAVFCPCLSFCCLDQNIILSTEQTTVVLNKNENNVFVGSTFGPGYEPVYIFEVICDKTVFGETSPYAVYRLRVTTIDRYNNKKVDISTLINSYRGQTYALIPFDGTIVGYAPRVIFVYTNNNLLSYDYNSGDGFCCRVPSLLKSPKQINCPSVVCECLRKVLRCRPQFNWACRSHDGAPPKSELDRFSNWRCCPKLDGPWPCPPPQCPYTFVELSPILSEYLRTHGYYIITFAQAYYCGTNTCLNYIAHVFYPPSIGFVPPPPPFTVIDMSPPIPPVRIINKNSYYNYATIRAPYYSGWSFNDCSCGGKDTLEFIEDSPDNKFLSKITVYIEFDKIACKPGTVSPEEYLLLREQYLSESGCIMTKNNDKYSFTYRNLSDTCANYWFAVKSPKDTSSCFPTTSSCPPPPYPLDSEGPCSNSTFEHPEGKLVQASVCKSYDRALPSSGYYDLYLADNDTKMMLLSYYYYFSNFLYGLVYGDITTDCFWVSRFISTIYFIDGFDLNGPIYHYEYVIFVMREKKLEGTKKYDFWMVFVRPNFRDRSLEGIKSLYFPLNENLQYIRGPSSEIYAPSKIAVVTPPPLCQGPEFYADYTSLICGCSREYGYPNDYMPAETVVVLIRHVPRNENEIDFSGYYILYLVTDNENFCYWEGIFSKPGMVYKVFLGPSYYLPYERFKIIPIEISGNQYWYPMCSGFFGVEPIQGQCFFEILSPLCVPPSQPPP